MIEIAEPRIETPLDELTFEELDQLGRRITEWIARANEQHDQVMVDLLIAAKNRLNKLKAKSTGQT